MLLRFTRPAARALLGGWKLALMTLVVALMSLGSAHDGEIKPAFGAGPSADFSAVVAVNGAPIKDGCDSLFNDLKCVVHPGGTFQVQVFLDKLPAGLPDGPDPDGVGGAGGVQVRFNYSPNLIVKPGTISCANLGISGTASLGPGDFLAACFPGIGQNGYISGNVLSLSFNCPTFKTKETITLRYGPDAVDTYLIDENGGGHYTETGPVDTVIVNCDNPLPADVTGDGFVAGTDFFAVLAQFGACKPGLC